jgi:hypothetical protein
MNKESLATIIAASLARSEKRITEQVEARLAKIDDNAILKAGTSAIIQSNLATLVARADGILLRKAKRLDTSKAATPSALKSLLGGNEE